MVAKSVSGLLIGAALLAGAVGALPATAMAQSSCVFNTRPNVLITLQRVDAPVQFDNSRSREDLARLQRLAGSAPALSGSWFSVGLTQTELRYRMRVSIEAYRLSGGRYCARLREVEGSLGYDRMNVYIARRYQPGSCAYNSIANHEMSHVNVFNTALDGFYPRMQQSLDQASRRLGPIVATSPDRAAERLQQQMSRIIDPLFREMNKSLDQQNALLDTPENYRREQQRCPDW